MSTKFRFLGSLTLGLAMIGGICWAVSYVIQSLWHALSGINPQLAVGVVAGGTTIVAAAITVMLGRYLERKREIEAHFRTEKIRIYDAFVAELLKALSDGSGGGDEMVIFIKQWQQKLVLWGGSNVLKAYFKWMNSLKGIPNAQTVFLMDEFFRALRADVGQSSQGLERGAFANLILTHGDFFLAMAKKNPSLTLEELGAMEKVAFGQKDQA